jgi:hypothetical protein
MVDADQVPYYYFGKGYYNLKAKSSDISVKFRNNPHENRLGSAQAL